MCDISSRERAKVVFRRIQLLSHGYRATIIADRFQDGNKVKSSTGTGPQKGTSRLTGDCMPDPVTNELVVERGSASTFPKKKQNGILFAAQDGVFWQLVLSFLAAWCRVNCLVATRYSVLT